MNSGPTNFRDNSNFSKKAKTNYNYIVDEETDDTDDDLTEMFYFDVDENDSVVEKGITILDESFHVENNGLLKDNKTKENNDKLMNGINIINDQIYSVKPLTVNLIVEGKLLEFEIDTGASISAISTEIWKKSQLKNLPLQRTERKFKAYQGAIMIPVGLIEVNVCYGSINKKKELHVFTGSSKPIVRHEWIKEFGLIKITKCKDFESINSINDREISISKLIKEFKDV
ncbi:GSCOCG00005320001-RA-CDS, partial [Cotesia congregata]